MMDRTRTRLFAWLGAFMLCLTPASLTYAEDGVEASPVQTVEPHQIEPLQIEPLQVEPMEGDKPVEPGVLPAQIVPEAADTLPVQDAEGDAQHAGGDTPASVRLTMPDVPADFSTYDGGWLQVAYHPSLAARVRVLTEQADQVRSELIRLLGKDVLQRVFVRVGRTAGEMETLAPEGTRLPKYASGVAFSELELVLLTAAPRYPGAHHDLPEVFRHELAHIALHDAVSRVNVSRWFNEGFAVHASGEAETARIQALWTAAVSDNLIPFQKLRQGFPADSTTASVAYAQAADMVRFLLRSGEEHRFRALIRRIAAGQSFELALSDAYATNMFTLETKWRENVAQRYTFWPILFGGSFIWVAAIALLIGGYVRRKRRAHSKLARWEREEALEDARREWAQAVLDRGQKVRVVLTRSPLNASGLHPSPLHRNGSERGNSNHKTGHDDFLPPSSSEHPLHDDFTHQAAPSRRDTATPLVAALPTIEHEGQRYTLH